MRKKMLQTRKSGFVLICVLTMMCLAAALMMVPGHALARNIKVGIIDCYSGPPAVYGKDALNG
ncbi:MAG: hypothetical protein P8X96_00645, partial [Desulfobacteraceae bacterium]